MLSASQIEQLLDGTSQRSLASLFSALKSDIDLCYYNASNNSFTIDTYTDFGTPSGTTYILQDNKTYMLTTKVTLPSGYTITAGRNSPILGYSSENCILEGTLPSGVSLVNSQWSMPIRNVSFSVSGDGNVFNLDATGNENQAIDWYGVNILKGKCGLVKNYSNFVVASMLIQGHNQGFIFDGECGTLSFVLTLFGTPEGTGCTHITLPSTSNITRRFRSFYSAFVAPSGTSTVALSVSTGAVIPTEAYILDNVNFSGGSESNYIQGVQYTDNKALFKESKGVTNTSVISQMYMEGNVTPTIITGSSNYTKILGTTIANIINQKTEHSDNRLTIKSAITKTYRITGTASLSSGNNNNIYIKVFVNGVEGVGARSEATTSGTGRSENVKINWVGVLRENDYVEIWVRNLNGNNITVSTLDVIIEGKE